MIENIRDVSPQTLRAEVEKFKGDGWRLVTMTCVELDAANVDILYHFDKDLRMEHLRMKHAKASPVPSISGTYFAALLSENEMQGHFGLCFEGLVVDYGQTLLLDGEARRTPFCKYDVTEKAPEKA